MSQLGLTFSSGFVRALLDAAEVVPQEIDALLLQAEIPPDAPRQPGARVTEEQVSALYRLLAVRFDDELPRLLSHPLRGGAMKFTGLSIVSTPTLGAALYRYSRFLRLIIHDFEIVHVHDAGLSTLTVKEPESGRRCKSMAIEILLKVIHGFTSWLVARELQLLRVDFAFPKPSYAADLQNLFPGPLHFDQPCSQLVFEPRQMSLRVQRSTADLKGYLGRLPSNWMCVPSRERLASHQVRDYLLGQDIGKIQVAQMAQALHLSVRTLYRRLEAEHTSFQQVKDEVRRDVAIDRLTNGDEPVSQIAVALGFGDTSSFHRAFRAWTGMTPNAYRQHGAAEE
jgi:AraC-like DNA-binding protein